MCILATDIKGTFHARMGMIKDRNGKDLAEAEEIKKRCPRIHRTEKLRETQNACTCMCLNHLPLSTSLTQCCEPLYPDLWFHSLPYGFR